MWFHIARCEGFFSTDADLVDMCISDTYYSEDVDRIPRETTQNIPVGSNPGDEYDSGVEDSGESSSRCSEAAESATEQSGDDNDPDGNE